MKARLQARRINQLFLSNFKGCDFTNATGEVNISRSPDMLNMISDMSGLPVKRFGYEQVAKLDGRINGIHKLVTTDGTKRLIHAGTKLYLWGETQTVLYDSMNDKRSLVFQMDKKLWILDGKKFLMFDVNTIKTVESVAYIPTTTIAMSHIGDGEGYEKVNMLTSLRKNRFLGTAGTLAYSLDTENLAATSVVIELLQANGSFKKMNEGAGFTVNRATGVITFTTAPGVSPSANEDNIYITFAKTAVGYADKINKCTIFAIYGIGASDRAFLSGNDELPNADFYSSINDPTYFPDTSYSIVGQDNTAIMGYLKTGEYLAPVKEDNLQDATVFLRSGTMINNQPVFTLKQGIAGVGAISKYCFNNLRDDQCFLSKQGYFAITTNAVTSERYTQLRSYFINKKLISEPNLQDAAAFEYQQNLYLSINDRCYVADIQQKSQDGKSESSFQYEWYFWDNIPARCFFEDDGLYFGTPNGEVMRFNSTKVSKSYNDNGKAISCRWTTPKIDFGNLTVYKTLKAIYLELNPFVRSSCEVFMRSDGIYMHVDGVLVDIFNFEDLNFERFTFNTNADNAIKYIKSKEKKIITTQLRLQNSAYNEGFGIYEICLNYILAGRNKGG